MTDNRFPPTPGIAAAVASVQRGYDNAEKRNARKRSVHGGPRSHLCVEVMPLRSAGMAGFVPCSDTPADAFAYGVYIRNPIAFHISDFPAASWSGRERPATHEASLGRARVRAFLYADALADHLGCEVVSPIER